MNATKPDQTETFDARELGAMMREMRENLGHDLETVAADLRIRLVYLEAIESGRLSDLPGNAYVSGFLRAYSDHLGLDGEEIVRRFKMAGAEISSQTQLHLPSPVEEGRLPTALILLVAAIIAAGAYGGWYYLSSDGGDPMETVAKLPRELSGLVNGAANQTAPTPAQAEQAPAPETPALESPPPADPPSEAAVPAAPEENSAATGKNPVSPPTETRTEPAAAAVEPETGDGTETPETTDAAPSDPTPSEPATVSGTVDAGSNAAPALAGETPPAAETPSVASPPAEERTASAPAVEAAPVPDSEPETPAPVREAQTAAVPPAPTPEPAPAPEPAPVPAQEASAPAETPAPAQPVSRISPGNSGDTIRIVVRAIADSYVAVRTADNEPLFSQLMRPGDSYEVPSGADLLLETGNAGGLQITVNGTRIPSLGPTGEVRRNIPLDAEKLLAGAN